MSKNSLLKTIRAHLELNKLYIGPQKVLVFFHFVLAVTGRPRRYKICISKLAFPSVEKRGNPKRAM
jgi:hypothetical protein